MSTSIQMFTQTHTRANTHTHAFTVLSLVKSSDVTSDGSPVGGVVATTTALAPRRFAYHPLFTADDVMPTLVCGTCGCVGDV